MKTIFLLGAGFSMPAGYPSGDAFNQKFFKSVEGKLLKFSSSEWAWDEHGDAASNNGRLNFDFLNISYLLSELVEQYQKETFEMFDYESFYEWFLSKWNDISFMRSCCDSVNGRLKGEVMENSSHFFDRVDINQYVTIEKCYNELIADLLGRAYNREEKYQDYKGFVDLIDTEKEVDIFTLNHDLLVEFLFKKSNIAYADGFSNVNSSIIGSSEEILPIYQGSYGEVTRLFKLHGSVDYFLFAKANQTNNYLERTGEYWFYKPGSYDNKHHSRRIDMSGKIVQDFNPYITPQFLIGKNKLGVINSHLIYKPLFEQFENSLSHAEKVIVIGYSYRDSHVNAILKKATDKFNFELININPNLEFPFRKDYTRNFVKQLSDLKELKMY